MTEVDLDGRADPPVPRSRSRRALRVGLSLALVVAIFVGVLPQVADLSEVRAEIGAMTGYEVGTLLLLGLWNLASYAAVYMASLPGLSAGQALVVTEASTAIANTVPAGAGFGIGVTWGMLTSWGFRRPEIALLVLVTGVWNLLIKLGLPIVALALLAVQGETTTGSGAAAAAGVASLAVAVGLFAVMLRSDSGARRVGAGAERVVGAVRRLVRRPPVEGWDDAAASFRASTKQLLRHRWLALTAATVVSHLSLFAVLLLSLRHVGVAESDVSTTEALASFAFVRLISALPLTPGGLGVVELGLTAALVAAGGGRGPVVAAVLVYRAVTYLLPIPLGAVSLLFWRRWQATPDGPTGRGQAPAVTSRSAP